MRNLFSLLSVVFLFSCASQQETLKIKQFQVRDQERDEGDDPMVRMEKSRHLLGAVSMEERRQRLGQYYTLQWSDPAGVGQGDVKVEFLYQQGATGSLVKSMTRDFSSSTRDGVVEFAVIGDDYFKNGKVLTWKATVSRGDRVLASKQSYLWE